MITIAALIICVLVVAAYIAGRLKASAIGLQGSAKLHSRPAYHGFYSAIWTAIAGFTAMVVLGIATDYYASHAVHADMNGALSVILEKKVAGKAARERAEIEAAHRKKFSGLRREQLFHDGRRMARGGVVARELDPEFIAVRSVAEKSFKEHLGQREWVVATASVLAALLALLYTNRQLSPQWRARNRSERIIQLLLATCATIAIFTTVGIVASLIGETVRFFSHIPVISFIFGTDWSPLSGVFEGEIDPKTAGAIPLFLGTMLITLIAMLVAVPVGLLAAVYLSDYAGPKLRAWAKPLLEILAGIPTVVYGFFAVVTVAPMLSGAGEAIGLTVASESALAAGLVMGIMIIPFISSLSDDVINAVPQSLRDGSYGLGATKAETISKVVLPAALPGIVSAVLLGISRAVGETMIVVMAAGQSANLTFNPLEAVTTVTVQIVALISGDTEAATAAGPAFALGFTLFCVTLMFNFLALRIVQKYRQKYD